MVNVICIRWGERYGAEYVNRLFHMVQRHLNRPFRFACLTDDTEGLEAGIETFPIPEIYVPSEKAVSPWRKLAIFAPKLGDLRGKTLFLDLDVVIVDQIDPFFDYADGFTIIENWTQKGAGIGNSSVFCFEIGQHSDVLEEYEQRREEVFQKFTNEQSFLSKHIEKLNYWPQDWCQSFKFHAIPPWPMRLFRPPRLPQRCRILVFHGHPNPDEAILGIHRSWRKFYLPAPWISEFWK